MTRFKRLAATLLPAAAILGTAAGQSPPGGQQPPLLGEASEGAPPGANTSFATAEPVAATAEVVRLRADLEQLLRSSGSRSPDRGVLVVSLDRGDTLYSANADLPLAPASNMKLFSTAAALYYLGPDFRYSTYVLADGDVADGVLWGDVVLYGTGDPAISGRMLGGSLTPLRALADSLLAHGIQEVRGDVVGDGSYFDDAWVPDGWRERYRLASYSAPVGALSFSENVVSIRVTPGAGTGQPAVIQTTPATDGLLVDNHVQTVARGRSTVRFTYSPEGLVIEGQLTRGHPGVARTVTVVDPANYTAAAFRKVLEDAGIAVHGGVRTIRVPEDSPIGWSGRSGQEAGVSPPRVIGTHMSPTLGELVRVTNHVSQNLYAEALFKTVGRLALGEGTNEASARAVQYFLECEGPVDLSVLRIVDGSGLSPLDRVTTRATIHLLDLMTRTDVWDVFYASLPEAATRSELNHTLTGRMRGTPASGNLRAKTGTISDVSSLSGYVRAANGELLAFSIFANELASEWEAKRTEDRIGVLLAGFSRPDDSSAHLADGDAVGAVAAQARGPGRAGPPRAGPEPVESAEAVPEASPASEPSAAPPTRTHQVAGGETLDGIARRYGTTVAALQRANPGIQPRRLQVGQTLTIPGE